MSEVERALREGAGDTKVDEIKKFVETLRKEGKSPDEIMESVKTRIEGDTQITSGVITHTVKAII